MQRWHILWWTEEHFRWRIGRSTSVVTDGIKAKMQENSHDCTHFFEICAYDFTNECSIINFWNAYFHEFLLQTLLWITTEGQTKDSSSWKLVWSVSNIIYRYYFWTDPFVHHIIINLGYLPVNQNGSDIFCIQWRFGVEGGTKLITFWMTLIQLIG